MRLNVHPFRLGPSALAFMAALTGCEWLFPVDRFMDEGDDDATKVVAPDANEGRLPRDATVAEGSGGADAELDSEPLGDRDAEGGGVDAGDASTAPPPVAVGCDPFQNVAGVTSLTGDSRSLPLPEGGALWVVDQGVFPEGGTILAPAFTVAAGAAADCTSWAATFEGPAFAASPVPNGFVGALNLVQGGSGPALFYELYGPDASAPLGLQPFGVGLAPLDPGSGRFVPTSGLLWSPDLPAYGGSALRVGSTVYVYGCSSSGSFAPDPCFVARADASALTSSGAYTYWAGDHWSASSQDAMAIAQAGIIVSVRPVPGGAGYVMTYVSPLGSTLMARTAIAPEGPWSDEKTLAACDLAGAGPGAFCAGAQRHPELAQASGGPLNLTYDARVFAVGATDAGLDAAVFGPHLVAVPAP